MIGKWKGSGAGSVVCDWHAKNAIYATRDGGRILGLLEYCLMQIADACRRRYTWRRMRSRKKKKKRQELWLAADSAIVPQGPRLVRHTPSLGFVRNGG